MCGLCGKVGPEPDRQRLDRAVALLCHRGPDANETWTGERVMLGHTRLAILDLSPRGAQPFTNEDGSVRLVFNGLIYNFRDLRAELRSHHEFRSDCDTEVLVHGFEQWGIDGLLGRLHGMFAFALWDQRTETLHLARDRLGKKPLFYSLSGGSISFASTLPATLELADRTPDIRREAVKDYLTYLCVPGEETIVEGVRRLPPAHRAEFRWGDFKMHRYWDVSYAEKDRLSEREWVDRIDTYVRHAVSERLVADVPLGVFLSGGVDSSLVAAMAAAQSSGPVVTIAASFEGDAYDEAPWSRKVAAHLGSDHHELRVTADAASMLPQLVFAAGEPFADAAMLPTMAISKAAREHVKVVLTGDGGDEAFGGYPSPMIARLMGPYMRLPLSARKRLLARLESIGTDSRVGRTARRLRRVAVTSAQSQASWLYDPVGQLGFRGLTDDLLTSPYVSSRHDPDAYWAAVLAEAPGATFADRVLYTELTTLLPDQFLVKTDTATMSCGLEARCPLLDSSVIEMAARIPVSRLIGGFRLKRLLKLVAARYVPRDAVFRRKHAFAVPVHDWMRGDLGALASDWLLSPEATNRGIFRPDAVKRLFAEHAGGADHGYRLWTLLVFEAWMRMFVDRTLKPTDELSAAK